MSIESVTLSNHLILCCSLLLPSVTKYWFPFDFPYPLQPCETIEVTLSPPVTHQLAMGLGLRPLTRGRVDGGIMERGWRAAGGDLTWIIRTERLSQPCLGVPAARAPLGHPAPAPTGQPAPLPPGPTPAPTGQPAPTLPTPIPTPMGQPAPSSPHSTSPMTSSPFTERRWYPSQTSSPPTSSRLSKSPEPARDHQAPIPWGE